MINIDLEKNKIDLQTVQILKHLFAGKLKNLRNIKVLNKSLGIDKALDIVERDSKEITSTLVELEDILKNKSQN